MTFAPSASRRSHRCEPRNPEPPVTKIRCCRCMKSCLSFVCVPARSVTGATCGRPLVVARFVRAMTECNRRGSCPCYHEACEAATTQEPYTASLANRIRGRSRNADKARQGQALHVDGKLSQHAGAEGP